MPQGAEQPPRPRAVRPKQASGPAEEPWPAHITRWLARSGQAPRPRPSESRPGAPFRATSEHGRHTLCWVGVPVRRAGRAPGEQHAATASMRTASAAAAAERGVSLCRGCSLGVRPGRGADARPDGWHGRLREAGEEESISRAPHSSTVSSETTEHCLHGAEVKYFSASISYATVSTERAIKTCFTPADPQITYLPCSLS